MRVVMVSVVLVSVVLVSVVLVSVFTTVSTMLCRSARLLALLVVSSLQTACDAALAAENPTPERVVSLSLCMDELVLALAEPEHIAAVSVLARDPRYSRLWRQAQALPHHNALAEQIVALRPDLILAAEYEQGQATTLLRQLGYTVHALPTPATLAQVPDHVREVAKLVGAEQRAETLLRQLATELATARAAVNGKPALLALSLAPNGYTAGTRSIKNELLHLTGYRSAADVLNLPYDSELALEQLVALAPDRIFLEEQQGDRNALAQRLLQHPALISDHRTRRINIDSANWLCPGLGLGAAALALAEAH